MTREQLEQIARAVMALATEPHFNTPRVVFGVNDQVTDDLLALGADQSTRVYFQEPAAYVIESARLIIGCVEFVAQREDRPATDEELALKTAAREHEPLIAATVPA